VRTGTPTPSVLPDLAFFFILILLSEAGLLELSSTLDYKFRASGLLKSQ
jgi:hypothetical protein